MAKLTDSVREVLDKKTFAHLATLLPDGSPHSTPVWVDYDGDTILINTAEGRQKPANLRNDGRIALSATDPTNPYKSVMIRGQVTEITEEGADEHIDRMALKYLGEETYPSRAPGEVRLLVKIAPEQVSVHGD